MMRSRKTFFQQETWKRLSEDSAMGKQEILQSFLEILREEIQVYRSLVDLLQEEQKGLIRADVEALEEMAKKKETVYLKVKLLEESRLMFSRKYCETFHIREELTLSRIIRDSEGYHTSELKDCQTNLKELFTVVSDLVRMNERLVGSSLRFLRGSNAILSGLTGEGLLYKQNGQFTEGNGSICTVNRKA